MIYVYDILLNLQPIEESLEFYEWKQDDLIEHIFISPKLTKDIDFY